MLFGELLTKMCMFLVL
ncbi:hypothetical protein OIU77_029321, partial [Salix suchowensis]